MVDYKASAHIRPGSIMLDMNKTSSAFDLAHASQAAQACVLLKYMTARARSTPVVSSRAAISIEHHKSATRSRVPRDLDIDELNPVLLEAAFRSSLPLPALLDSDFESALRHVLDNP